MEHRNAVKVGVFTFISLVLVAALLIWKSSIFLRATGYELIGDFNNVNGLLPRAEVRYRGYRIGKVAEIIPGPKSIQVHFWVEPGVKIPKGSSLRVIFDGLVGEKYLDIRPNPSESRVLVAGEVLSGYATSGLADFVDVGTQNLEEMKAILNAFKGVLTDPQVLLALKNTTLSIEKISGQLSAIAENGDLANIVKDLSVITKNLRGAMDENSAESLRKTVENLEVLTSSLRELSTDAELKSHLKSTLKGSRDFLNTVNAITLDSSLSVGYQTAPKSYQYLANLDVGRGESFLRFGVGNRDGVDRLVTIQQSVPLLGSLRTRFGIFYNSPGIGLDYGMGNATLTADVYDFGKNELDLTGRYQLLESLDLFGGMYHVLREPNRTMVMGVSLHPPK